jgi:hypothetical protein
VFRWRPSTPSIPLSYATLDRAGVLRLGAGRHVDAWADEYPLLVRRSADPQVVQGRAIVDAQGTCDAVARLPLGWSRQRARLSVTLALPEGTAALRARRTTAIEDAGPFALRRTPLGLMLVPSRREPEPVLRRVRLDMSPHLTLELATEGGDAPPVRTVELVPRGSSGVPVAGAVSRSRDGGWSASFDLANSHLPGPTRFNLMATLGDRRQRVRVTPRPAGATTLYPDHPLVPAAGEPLTIRVYGTRDGYVSLLALPTAPTEAP